MLPAIRANEPQLICVFLLDLIPGDDRAWPIDYDEKCKTIPVPGWAVLSLFQIESHAKSVLIVRKIHHTQIGSVPVVLSAAFPYLVCPFLQKSRSVKTL
jgi:hypothetical protein